ncbi:MAG: ATP-binding protein [Streptosporangiales bacterium]|jgi:anti-sigma regulatory factor (Ser/Thr protein kinase)|nr:ATP-binding protein [Streptosporangiales bacterium]
MTITTDRRPPDPQTPGRYRSDSAEFGACPGAVALARLHTRVVLAAWDLEELAEAATQVVSELMTNAIEAHQRERLDAPVRLTLLAGLRTILIVVRDSAAGTPRPEDAGETGEHGRGLIIVDALAARWDCRVRPDGGKTIRALLRGARHA